MLTNSKSQQEAPKDNGWLVYWSMYLFGFAALTPWASFCSSVDYFQDAYADWHAVRWMTVLYYTHAISFMGFVFWKPSLVQKGLLFVAIGFLSSTALLALIPIWDVAFINDGDGKTVAFALVMVCSAILGLSVSMIEGSIMGITLLLPEQYPQGYIAGTGCSQFSIALLRVLTKTAFTDSADGLRNSAFVFFFVSAFVCLLAFLLCVMFVMQHPFVSFYMNKNPQEPAYEDAPLLQDATEATTNSQIFQTLKLPGLLLIVTYVVTISICPGTLEDVECDALGDWYSVILIVLFALGDYAGRSFPAFAVIKNVKFTVIGAILRTLLVPLFIIFVEYFSNPFIIGTLLVILGLTNGYWTLIAFIIGHEKLSGYHESLIGGYVLFLSMFVGINIGAALSLIIAKLF